MTGDSQKPNGEAEVPRRRVFVPEQRAVTFRIGPDGKKEKSWWQHCKVEEFLEQIEKMNFDEVAAVGNEIGSAIAITQATAQNINLDGDLRRRASMALGFMVEKRKLLKGVIRQKQRRIHRERREEKHKNITKREERRQARNRLVDEARGFLKDGQIEKAIENILIVLGGKEGGDDR